MQSENLPLIAHGLQLQLGSRQVLQGVDLGIAKGSLNLLAGRNGAGKSTLLRVLAGVQRADAGQVILHQTDLGKLPHRQRARLITLIPQDSDSPFEFTGRELVMMGRHPHMPRFQGPGEEDRRRVQEALLRCDATQFADRSVSTLSGGELQRISIARALATDAQVLLADEPTANLDLEHALAILALLQDLAQRGHTVLLASHDLNQCAPYADQVLILHAGAICSQGTPAEVLNPELMARVFAVRSQEASGYFPRDFRPLKTR